MNNHIPAQDANNISNPVRTTHEMSPLLKRKSDFEEWKSKTFNLGRQVVFSFIFATIIFPTPYSFFTFTVGKTMVNWGSLFLYLNLLLIGNGFYWLVFLPGTTRVLTASMKKLSLFDFKNTFWVSRLSTIYTRAAISASIIGVMIIIPIILGPQAKNITIIATA